MSVNSDAPSSALGLAEQKIGQTDGPTEDSVEMDVVKTAKQLKNEAKKQAKMEKFAKKKQEQKVEVCYCSFWNKGMPLTGAKGVYFSLITIEFLARVVIIIILIINIINQIMKHQNTQMIFVQ